MHFTMRVEMGGAAFEDNPSELSGILTSLGEYLTSPTPGRGVSLDSNGNKVGVWEIHPDEEER